MSVLTRRRFLETTLAGVAATAVGCAGPGRPRSSKPAATDWVPLGKTGLKIPRMGMGTGTGSTQRNLGQEGFTRLVRHAYDQGVRYIDTAESYGSGEMQGMIGKAIKGLPRDKIFIQSKIRPERIRDALKAVDESRKALDTDYVDTVLVHNVKIRNWAEEFKYLRDGLSEAKERKWIRARGASCHGLPALRGLAGCAWAEVNLCRINPQGTRVDGPDPRQKEPGDVNAAVENIKKIHAAGRGVIGMKIFGGGAFEDAADRERSIQFVMRQECVDAVVMGFKSPAEIDEAIGRVNRALASRV